MTGELAAEAEAHRHAPHRAGRDVVGAVAQPHELALEASPRRTSAIATWSTFDRGPASHVRRLARIAQ